MGSPDWGADPRFVSKANRVKNWDALHALMSQWSRRHDKQLIADTAQREVREINLGAKGESPFIGRGSGTGNDAWRTTSQVIPRTATD